MSKTRTKKSDARQRLIETAERLFYAEGIHTVGIDRIITEAGVAKMTLYNHFPSKDDLILAVLEFREAKFDTMYEKWMAQHIKTGKSGLEAFFAALKDWFKSPDFQGCMFINSNVEIADVDHAASKFSAEHKERFHDMLKQIIADQAGTSTADKVAAAIALMVEGAIVTAVMEQSVEPADVAKDAALALVNQFEKTL